MHPTYPTNCAYVEPEKWTSVSPWLKMVTGHLPEPVVYLFVVRRCRLTLSNPRGHRLELSARN